jgi:hypothetical protein
MPDAWHTFGADLQLGPTGDLLTVDGAAYGQQRLIRRLLTNAGDYLWQLDYGGGLGRMVGTPAIADTINALILAQASKEAAIAQSPVPVVSVTVDPSGIVTASIKYTDAETGIVQLLTVPVS